MGVKKMDQNKDLELVGTLQIWRNQLILVLEKGKTPRLEEIGTKYYLNFEDHRATHGNPNDDKLDYLGYRINRKDYPERIRRIVVFEGRYYYLTQNKESSNETKLTFIPFEDNEDQKEWKKFYLPKDSREVVIYSENDQ